MDLLALFGDMIIDGEGASKRNEEVLRKQINVAFMCPIPFERESKNDQASVYFKEEGDRCLSRRMYQDAIQDYTNALRMAIPNSETEAACYHARAIALQRTNAYEECALDIERALQLSLTDEKKKELLQMQKRLAESRAARQSKGNKAAQKDRPNNDVAVSYEENPEVPGATDAMKLVYSEKFGRHFVAVKPISAGDVLLVQKPYFTYPFEEKELSYCHYCLKPTVALIPCDSCTDTLYCSPECRANAYEKYHRVECKFSGAGRDIKLLIRLFLIATNQGATLKEAVNQLKRKSETADGRTFGFVNNQFNGQTAEATLSLIDHADKGLHYGFITTAAVVTNLLRTETEVLTGHDIYDSGNLLFRLMCVFRRNVVMIRDKHLMNVSAESLYPVFNLLNHSCVSNTIWYMTESNKRILRASKDIKPGEQIFNNYLSHDILFLTAEKRKEILFKGKYFTCECEACSTNYTFKSEIKRLKVPVSVQRQLKKNPIDVSSIWQVLKCMQRERNSPCGDVELLKFILMEAYMNGKHPFTMHLYKSLGILENLPRRR